LEEQGECEAIEVRGVREYARTEPSIRPVSKEYVIMVPAGRGVCLLGPGQGNDKPASSRCWAFFTWREKTIIGREPK
jgi:hypothetical protein